MVSNIVRTTSSFIGHTPLVRISEKIYAKLETINPSGSIKDRMAMAILDAAEVRGELKPGGTIVEATSGNSGIALSMLAAERGYNMIVVMPANMSEERKNMIKAYGAKIVQVPAGDFAGAVEKRDALVKELNAFCPNQFANPDNIECHYKHTGKEILQQVAKLEGNPVISAFVSGTGTGGTLMGVRKALIRKYPHVQVVAVEPSESAVMSGGEAHEHSIQGIGDGFIPPIVDMNCIDEVIAISSHDAIERAKRLAKELGLFVGISSGANVLAAERYIGNHHPKGIVITLLPDRGERYMSMVHNVSISQF
ncbi:MAG: PLP-dependent cysteine synthase family protein [Chitinophagales bacterium]